MIFILVGLTFFGPMGWIAAVTLFAFSLMAGNDSREQAEKRKLATIPKLCKPKIKDHL